MVNKVDKSNSSNPDTQERILLSAREIFVKKGMNGTRMQEIADHAGINKSLLHYYFRTKELLFLAVFESMFRIVLTQIAHIFDTGQSLREIVPEFFKVHGAFMRQDPDIPLFILSELHQNPVAVEAGVALIKKERVFFRFTQLVNREIEAGKIDAIEPIDLLVTLLSLSVFPFVARPLLEEFLNMDDHQYNQFLDSRLETIGSFVVNAIK